MKLNLGSGLKSSVTGCVGKICIIDLADGWGWARRRDGRNEEVEWDFFYNKTAELELVELLQLDGVVRGIRGILGGEFRERLGREVLAFSLFDGLEFDLDQALCPGWLLLFDATEFLISPDGEISFDDNNFLVGFGENLRVLMGSVLES